MSLTHIMVADEEHQEPPKKKQHLNPSEKTRIYKAKLSYRKEWEKKHSCVSGALASILVMVYPVRHARSGKPSSGIKRCMENQGITNWNHTTKLPEAAWDSQWHREAESGKSVLGLHCSSVANRLLNVDREPRCSTEDVNISILSC